MEIEGDVLGVGKQVREGVNIAREYKRADAQGAHGGEGAGWRIEHPVVECNLSELVFWGFWREPEERVCIDSRLIKGETQPSKTWKNVLQNTFALVLLLDDSDLQLSET